MHQSPHARRIVLSTLGSLGDLNPYVRIALELKARGHRPIIATTSVYREKIERLGIGFHRVRPDLPSYDRPEELRMLVEKCVARRTGASPSARTDRAPYKYHARSEAAATVRLYNSGLASEQPLCTQTVARPDTIHLTGGRIGLTCLACRLEFGTGGPIKES